MELVLSRTRLFMEPWFQGRAITEKMKRLDNVVSVYIPQASPHVVNVNVSRGLSITTSLRSKFFLFMEGNRLFLETRISEMLR